MRQLLSAAGEVAGTAVDIGGVSYVGHKAPQGAGAADVRRLALDVRGRLPDGRPGVVVVVGGVDGKPSVVVAVNDAGQEAGLSANDLVKVAAGALGGSGGGKADVAQGGGVDAAQAGEALRQVGQALSHARGA
jgi:alanyl-tRNA synthetase